LKGFKLQASGVKPGKRRSEQIFNGFATACVLHPASCILDPGSWILPPATCNLRPASCILPCSSFFIPHICFRHFSPTFAVLIFKERYGKP
jgi:hypothetical protein